MEVRRLYHRFDVEPHAMVFALQADWRKQHVHDAKDRHYLSTLGLLLMAAALGNALDAMIAFLLCLWSARRMRPWWW